MMVKCIANDLAKVMLDEVRDRLARSIHIDGPIRDLQIDRDYKVHAIEYRDGGYWLFIHAVAESDFPYPYPAEFFRIVDGEVPASWAVKFIDSENGTVLKRLSFREWASDDSFYEGLVEGIADSVALYRRQL